MTDTESAVEISDPAIDIDEMMRRISERLRTRQAQAAAQGLDYDYLTNTRPTLLASRHLSKETLEWLSQLFLVSDEVLTQVAMRDRRFPLFNRLLFRFEMLLHRLVVKYVNLYAGRQIVFNRTASRAVVCLAWELERAVARIESLENQLAELRQQTSKSEQA